MEIYYFLNTLMECFTKDSTKESYLNASEDLEYFCTDCRETRNEYLPKYEISFVEVKRLEYENGVLSASSVRKCMENDNWNIIYDMVPLSTYKSFQYNFGVSPIVLEKGES